MCANPEQCHQTHPDWWLLGRPKVPLFHRSDKRQRLESHSLLLMLSHNLISSRSGDSLRWDCVGGAAKSS